MDAGICEEQITDFLELLLQERLIQAGTQSD
ncbi:hypothetical protein [Cohnella kolymensis]